MFKITHYASININKIDLVVIKQVGMVVNMFIILITVIQNRYTWTEILQTVCPRNQKKRTLFVAGKNPG